jgi:hypothetical protein
MKPSGFGNLLFQMRPLIRKKLILAEKATVLQLAQSKCAAGSDNVPDKNA